MAIVVSAQVGGPLRASMLQTVAPPRKNVFFAAVPQFQLYPSGYSNSPPRITPNDHDDSGQNRQSQ